MMNTWFEKQQKWLSVSLLFISISILAYGLQIFHLGFYLDDWVILNAYNLGGPELLFQYTFLDNRPLVFWVWLLGFKLLGSVPLYWQIWALAWRLLTVIILWRVLILIWPNAYRQVTLSSLLFLIYPLFSQQATALTFSFHWICFFFWGLSVWLMIQAIRSSRYFFVLLLLSVLFDGIQLFTQEYFLGLDFLRPIILWIVLSPKEEKRKSQIGQVTKLWLPYLVLLLGSLTWRAFLMPTVGADRNTPTVLFGLIDSPVSTLTKLIEMFMQDTVHTLLGVWYRTYQPDLFTLSPISSLAAWGVALIGAGLVYLVINRMRFVVNGELTSKRGEWYREAIPFGMAALIFGFLPGWMIGRHVYDLSGIYNDRFGMASMFGAAIVIVGLIEFLRLNKKISLIFLSILIGLGLGQNFRYQTTYRRSWESQLRLYWQISWRMPDIQTPARILGEGSMIPFIGSWVTTSAINQIYRQSSESTYVDFMYFDLTKPYVSRFVQGEGELDPVKVKYMDFSAPEDNNLVIAYNPEENQCLWVLQPLDQFNPYLSSALQSAAPISNPELILASQSYPLRADIFGDEPVHDWCYFYEKADLARQFGDWKSTVAIWHEARENGKRPRVGVEYGPFIEGFAHLGNWEEAINLTTDASRLKFEMRKYLGTTWRRISDSTGDTPEKQDAIIRVIEDFECQDEFGR